MSAVDGAERALDLSVKKQDYLPDSSDWDYFYSDVELSIMAQEIEDQQRMWDTSLTDQQFHKLTDEVEDCDYVSQACFDLGFDLSDSFESEVMEKFPKPASVPA